MKKISFLIAILLLALSIQAQSPQKFSYQTVIRNTSNQLLVGQTVGIKISILQGSANGSAVYAETHTPQTNANGLATLEIGGGTLLSGNFTNINWANGPFFVKTETDPNGGNNYTITNTSQLLSVPYALYAKDVSSSFSVTGDTLFIGRQSYIIPGISQNSNTGSPANCGATNVHNPAKIYGSMTDQEGNAYKTIVIGTQEWMAENLKTSIYLNGDQIANVSDGALWSGLTTGAWAYYNNESQYECPFGKLYNWYAVADPRHVCPSGWREPTETDWLTLIEYLGGENTAGGKMKSTGLQYWDNNNLDASNYSGFSGLPVGEYSGSGGEFVPIGFNANWWSSTEYDNGNALSIKLLYSIAAAYMPPFFKDDGYSVRCLRD